DDGRIIETPILNHNDYRREIIRLPLDTSVKLKVRRGGEELLVDIVTAGSSGLGVIPPSNVVWSVAKDSPAALAVSPPESTFGRINSANLKSALEPGDEILEVNEENTLSAYDISRVVSQSQRDKPIPVKIRKKDGQIKTVIVTPTSRQLEHPYYDLGIETAVIVSGVRKESSAEKSGLKKNDKIIAIDNVPVKSLTIFNEVIRASAGKELKLKVLRELQVEGTGETCQLTITPATDPAGKGFIGVLLADNNEIGTLKENSPLLNHDISSGDKIIKATLSSSGKPSETKISSMTQLSEFLNKTKGAPIELTILSSGITKTIQVTPIKISEAGTLGIELKYNTVRSVYSLKDSITKGVSETLDLGLLTYQVLKKLFKGEESVKGLAGPIGIIRVSYRMAMEGLGSFFWLLALISINLAILNLLPIPVLDGGSIVFCLIEKLKGSPVSFKVQTVAQGIGLTIIVALVILTTINDILR
ncbi:MAG: site-2 protease family protein, partial [Planctomycetota bacterium]|nr:site-2 protease family protein [Planctomycetota bacterium]